MTEILPFEFEAFVRSTLEDLREKLTDAQQTINGIEYLINVDKPKLDRILLQTEEISKAMLSLPALTIQTNTLLSDLNTSLRTELRDTRHELREVSRDSSNKFSIKLVLFGLVFILIVFAIIQGYSVSVGGSKFEPNKKPREGQITASNNQGESRIEGGELRP